MKRRIYLYIGDELVDLDDDSFLLLNFSREEMTSPQAVLNSWTQTVKIPNTGKNAQILGNYYRLDHRTIGSGGTGTNFAALKRTPFRIFDDTGVILMRGYVKLESAAEDVFTIQLFGGLGQFFYVLTYDNAGNKLTMADCKYQYTGTYYAANAIYIRCWRTAVVNAWGALRYGAPNSGQVYDIINFAPCLNGTTYPFKFDTNKAAYRAGTAPAGVMPNLYVTYPRGGGGTYDPPNGGSTILLQFGQKHNEWEAQDLRSYCQRPIFSLRKMMEGIRKYASDLGYVLNYDADFWNDDNEYLKYGWMTLPFVDRDNLTDVELQMMTAADFLKGTLSPAEYLVAIAKTFGFVFETSPDGTTIQMRLRDNFYNGTTVDLTDRVDTSSVEVRPYDIDARFYDWDTEMAGMFCANYEAKYGRRYGSLRLDTGYDFDSNLKEVTASLPWKGCADVVDINPGYRVFAGVTDIDDGHSLNYLCKFAFTDTVKWDLEYIDPNGGREAQSFSPVFYFEGNDGMYYNNTAGHLGEMWLPLPQLHDADGKAYDKGGVLLFFEGQSSLPEQSGGGGITLNAVNFCLSDDTSEMLDVNGGVPCWNISPMTGNTTNRTAVTWVPSFRRWHFSGGTMQLTWDWGDPLEVPYTGDTFATGHGLYPNYWQTYMADRLNKDTAVMRCKVNLAGWQVSDALFRNFYHYGGSIWALNKVINHSVTTLGTTECEFVRIQAVADYTAGQLTF